MNFSARQAVRKQRGRGKMVAAAALGVLALALPGPGQARSHAPFGLEELFGLAGRSHRGARAAAQTARVPLPRPRPPEAPSRDIAAEQAGGQASKEPAKELSKEPVKEQARGEPETPSAAQAPAAPPAKPAEPAVPAAAAVPPVPPVSACRQALTDSIAIAPSIPAVHGPGGCGGDDLVRLEAIMLPDGRRVAVTPAATLRCPMAAGIADWVRSDVAPLTETLGSEIASLDNFDSFECRGRNRVKGAPLSEHGRANALDVRGFTLADGRSIGLTDRSQPRILREDVLHSACTRFMTVLGPDSDWYHEDHIHLDLMERHNNYKICQWDVLDPLPRVAPLLPAERPTEAPPREVAAQEDAKEQDGAKDPAVRAADSDGRDKARPVELASPPLPASRPRRSLKPNK